RHTAKYSPYRFTAPTRWNDIGPAVTPHSMLFATAAKVGFHVSTSGMLGRLFRYSRAGVGAGVKKVELRSTIDSNAACGPSVADSRAAVRSADNKLPTLPKICAKVFEETARKKNSILNRIV